MNALGEHALEQGGLVHELAPCAQQALPWAAEMRQVLPALHVWALLLPPEPSEQAWLVPQ